MEKPRHEGRNERGGKGTASGEPVPWGVTRELGE